MRPTWIFIFTLLWPLWKGQAQVKRPLPEALNWSIALGGRFRDLRDPVVAASAMANLGVRVCPHDRVAGAALFGDALARLRLLNPEAFRLPDRLLPVSSFTGLWSNTTSAAVKCDPALEESSDAERANAKMSRERQEANATLERGISLIDSKPDRAAQLAEGAMIVSDPSVLDPDSVLEFLSNIRIRAPDLADDVFRDVLDFLTATSADGRLIAPASGYALAVQILEDVDENVPLELIAELQKVIQRLSAQIGNAQAASILLELGLPAPDLRPILDRYHTPVHEAIEQIFRTIEAKNFSSARALAQDLPGRAASGQISSLINFAESAAAIDRKDLSIALNLANLLQPGIKRTLLYVAMSAAAADREAASGPLQLAFKDIEPLSAEYKMLTLAAAASAVVRKDPESGYLALSEAVKASNDAYRRPRTTFFDPAAARRAFLGRGSGTDASLILFSKRCLCEVIDTGSGRHYFGLHLPGANVSSLPGVVRNAPGADPARLEAILLNLNDERQMAEALNALVELRLGR